MYGADVIVSVSAWIVSGAGVVGGGGGWYTGADICVIDMKFCIHAVFM